MISFQILEKFEENFEAILENMEGFQAKIEQQFMNNENQTKRTEELEKR